MAFYQYKHEQFLPTDVDTLWDFISSPRNLKDITPPHMKFEILSSFVPQKMYPGMMIEYIICPVAHVPVRWVTEITHVRNRSYFVDEQRIGPYKIWHHEHIIEQVEGGVVMHDIVSYSPPFGVFGRLANAFFIKNKVAEIFAYRETVLSTIFAHKTTHTTPAFNPN
ncbi:MAG: SRPBCC family protein [Flavobacteriales bacterium]|nr:SRPBCC family protein [Flavobacteriales bacterium]